MLTSFWFAMAITFGMDGLPVARLDPPPTVVLFQEEVHDGKVVAVGADSITILDRKDDETDKFIVNADTKITRNGKPAKLSDVQVSDRAKIVAVQEGGKLIAKSITANADS